MAKRLYISGSLPDFSSEHPFPLADRTGTLVRICRTDKGWRCYSIALGKNGRIRPGWVLVAGEEEYYETGRYEVRYFEGRKMVYQPAGVTLAAAVAARERMERKLAAKQSVEAAGLVFPDEDRKRVNLAEMARAFIRDPERRGALLAADVNRQMTEEFLRVLKKTYLDDIRRDDIFAFHEALRKRGCSHRTIADKHEHGQLSTLCRYRQIHLPRCPNTTRRYPRCTPATRSRPSSARPIRTYTYPCGQNDVALV